MVQSLETPIVPAIYGGKWIAWNFHRTRILAIGLTFDEAKQAAEALGENKPVLAKVPRAEARFLGGKR